jgi:hypothetical protein
VFGVAARDDILFPGLFNNEFVARVRQLPLVFGVAARDGLFFFFFFFLLSLVFDTCRSCSAFFIVICICLLPLVFGFTHVVYLSYHWSLVTTTAARDGASLYVARVRHGCS